MADSITPPPELFTEWLSEAMIEHGSKPGTVASLVAEKAAQWGADQELEACVDWLDDTDCEDPQEVAQRLRAARRPKPPSLKERALHELAAVYNRDEIDDSAYDAIRLALEALPND
jgi:hypothetical protein